MDLLDAGGGNSLTLVFVETKRGASDLSYYLQNTGYEVVAIHGDLKQFEREKHLDSFRLDTKHGFDFEETSPFFAGQGPLR